MTDPLDLDAVGQAALVASGAVSPLELVDAAIARIEARNPALNAVIHPRFEAARAEAADPPDGPFRGVPFLVKDALCAMAGEPHHAGMAFLRRHDHRATHDSWLAERYRAAGFVILGRTNLPELALRATTEPTAYGPTQNPSAPGHTPGGSSGGSAAAVADGLVAAAHGNDMGGSIRIPASFCGLVGLKPSRGRTTIGPDFGEYWGQMTHEHVLCRSVRDSAAILDAVAGPGPGDPYTAPPPLRPWAEDVAQGGRRLRVGFGTHGWTGAIDPACEAAMQQAAGALADAGHDVVADGPEALDVETAGGPYVTVLAVHVAAELARLGRLVGERVGADDVEAGTWAMAEVGAATDAVTYWEAVEALHAWARPVVAWWRTVDLFVSPTSPVVAPLFGADDDLSVVAWTLPFNVTGQPAISLPVHQTDEGVPVGAQLVGPPGREDVVLRAAEHVMAALEI
ncbi:MAG: amidase [Acidimicrobiia bacterium]|nr:amidase [Acidimicrobiia bacterium]